MTTTTPTSAGPNDQEELLLLEEVQGPTGLEVEVLIDGDSYDTARTLAAKGCPHSEVLNVQTLIAFIKDETTDTVIEWQVRVRARCGSCATVFDIHPTGRRPRDGGHGVVLAMLPTKED
jgi:hypothetical protein